MPVSALFEYVAQLQGDRTWGALLDSGAGVNSTGWICSLTTERWTAVSASPGHLAQVEAHVRTRMRPVDRLVLGNWTDRELLKGEVYDTVLADYLLGAVEGFAPYFQEELFARLRGLTGRTLYVAGLDPYVIEEPRTEAGRAIWEIGRLRDACLLLAGEQPYREYPAEWCRAALERSGFRITAARKFPNRYKARFVNGQLDMCLQRLPKLADRELARALESRVERLRREALALCEVERGLVHGCDWVIAARPV
jgi:hypothetical protein